MVQNFFKVDQPRYIVSPLYLESKTKGIFAIACLGKKVSFSYGNLRISRTTNFKNRSFSYGQKLLQSGPTSVYSISIVPRD